MNGHFSSDFDHANYCDNEQCCYEGTTTVHILLFIQLPHSYGNDMFKIFQRWGRVCEVFISRRLNKRGKRFGYEVRNARQLEKELDGI
ncbi:hypothetical protein VNO80_02939 [Phaseolus coccineus]|uniref:RRM domain-containing protein n=1 Tax=Phaseolus coccineus TaxID=3886 RepID=A0AAN9NXS6_PHACN